ncbi:TonB-dependent receptor plug domain-containing protein [Fulvivirgaceae bacterium BMA12]|uniref:TonB-dependent receptor plug domain-containing protein n=1 Tax=Agaribacillus aureus TaxID=3051825 RepID=A0ABT8L7M3_9BACT|nr:TonB-dependent receptor plug domain-containing protein [Fulvivirgaceae bacterium BMA12]
MKSIFTIFIFVIAPSVIYGQTIKGSVTDAKNVPIEGAYIIHNLSGRHEHTNELGKFSMKVKSGDTLLVRHLGYKSMEVVVDDLSNYLEIVLSEASFRLDEIMVTQNVKAVNLISDINTELFPVNSSQEILRKVPGLFIGQHAGGGKAEQIFLRGFDIDHGTDIRIDVDGLPVNMVSHAHGQGYSDLHFLIPETVDKIDFGKGAYYADKGNFGTAGYVNFKTKDRLEKSSVSVEAGRFNTFRSVGLFKLADSDHHDAYVAAEYLSSDGAFESPQDFSRINVMGKYTANFHNLDRFSLMVSHFSSDWDASGQIPQRAVDAGLISRFGAIDDTEGGETHRTNVMLKYMKSFNDGTFLKNKLYYSAYDFRLFSNFTFFLNDPVNGDRIMQSEDRQLFGAESELNHHFDINNTEVLMQVGVGVRYDNNDDVELSRMRDRQTTIERLQFGDIDETNLFSYLNFEFDLGSLLINPGIRFDYFDFNYRNGLLSTDDNERQLSKSAVSPKLNFIYNYDENVQFFLKSGVGFHSNDARVVIDGARSVLPASYGSDLGVIWKPVPDLIINSALWYLSLEQEFVYVGDEGIVEPSGKTRRLGVDFGLQYQLLDWLFFNGDINYTYARSVDEPEGQRYIPLAPDLTVMGGFSVQKENFSGGLQMRYLKDRPANEDNSIVAEGYFITDVNVNYEWKSFTFGLAVENLFDQEWNETQFATESRLASEATSVEEIHFTPGVPFFLKGKVKFEF